MAAMWRHQRRISGKSMAAAAYQRNEMA